MKRSMMDSDDFLPFRRHVNVMERMSGVPVAMQLDEEDVCSKSLQPTTLAHLGPAYPNCSTCQATLYKMSLGENAFAHQ